MAKKSVTPGKKKVAKKKPVTSGKKPKHKGKKYKPNSIKKAQSKAKLMGKGVSASVAGYVTGEGEDIDNKSISKRRVTWIKGLPLEMYFV